MKIGLLSPPKPYLVRQQAQAPLGLLYLAAVAELEGHEVYVQDMLEGDEPPEKADVYGFTATTLDIKMAEDTAKRLKILHPEAKFVVGGPHVSALRIEYKHPVWDAIVAGEGESLFLIVLEAFADGTSKPYLEGAPHVLIDQLPFPARHLLRGKQGGEIFFGNPGYAPGPTTVISASRGCVGACAFCASRCMWTGYRLRPSWSVVSEMTYCFSTLNIRQFRFSDDTWGQDPQWAEQFCKRLAHVRTPYRFYWRASVRVDHVTPELLQAMHACGCRELAIGVESGDQRVLDTLRKQTTVEQAHAAVKMVHEAGIHARVLMMIGTPGETAETPKRNMDFLESASYDSVSLTTFVPFPGCAIWKEPRKFGCEILVDDPTKYNLYSWGGGGLTEWEPLISIEALNDEQQYANVKQMRDYLAAGERWNKG